MTIAILAMKTINKYKTFNMALVIWKKQIGTYLLSKYMSGNRKSIFTILFIGHDSFLFYL